MVGWSPNGTQPCQLSILVGESNKGLEGSGGYRDFTYRMDISEWGSRQQKFMLSQLNLFTKQNTYLS